jgi:hypothetical protein
MGFMVPSELIQAVMGCVRLSFFHGFSKIPLFFNLLLRSDYVPCTTPLNMTITLDDRPEIPLHPLDLTAEPSQDNQAEYCTGLIQTADSQLLNPSSSLGDIILGVPFLRNVYTVMAYTAPDANGSFAPVNGSNLTINPRLGLLSLTNPTIALEEFYTVRELNQPLSGGNSSEGSAGGSSGNSTVSVGGEKLSVGIVVLIGILSFFGLCCLLFAARWFMLRRTYRKAELSSTHGDVFELEKSSTTTEEFMLTKTISSTKDEKASMGFFKSDLEEAAFAVGVGEEKIPSDSSDDGTNVAVVEDCMVTTEVLGEGEERESMASGDNTLVQYQQKVNNPYSAQEPDHLHSPLSPSSPPQTQQTSTSSDPHSLARRSPSPAPDPETESQEEFWIEDNIRTSMAGIGTASRTSKAYLDSSFLRGINMNSGVMTSAESDDNGPSFAFIPARAL